MDIKINDPEPLPPPPPTITLTLSLQEMSALRYFADKAVDAGYHENASTAKRFLEKTVGYGCTGYFGTECFK